MTQIPPTPRGARESQRVDRDAAAWAARADGRELTPAETAALDAWLAADIRHVGSFAKARAVLQHADRARALGDGYDPAAFAAPRRGGVDRRFLLASGAAAALAAVSVASFTHVRRQSFRTAKGEVRRLPLEDGSVMTLNTASTVEVGFSRRVRHISLVEGEALFDVAHDAARPFIVSAGAAEARAVGTSFIVRRVDARRTRVLVREGAVRVGPPRDSANPLLTANRSALVEDGALTETADLAIGQIDGALAWRDGLIAFEGVTLAEALVEFSRYTDIPISAPEPRVRRLRITGLFAANDPAGFADAVAASLNLKVLRRETGISLIS